MEKSESEIEAEVLKKGLVAPRLTPNLIDESIRDESYTILPSGKTIICELILKNGFTVRDEASVVSKANFDFEIGKRISRADARNKIWQLEGYLLQEKFPC